MTTQPLVTNKIPLCLAENKQVSSGNFFSWWRAHRKSKALSVMEFALYILLISIILAAGVISYTGMSDGAKRTVTREEMKTLVNALLTYEVSSKTSSLPTDLGGLVTGLTAAQSNDGIAKTNLFRKTGVTNDPKTFTDGWGNQYQYNPTARTLTSTNNGGTPLVESF